jgi:hypothetical protein
MKTECKITRWGEEDKKGKRKRQDNVGEESVGKRERGE